MIVVRLVATKISTDIIVKDTLTCTQQLLAEQVTWRWEEYPLLNYMAVREYMAVSSTAILDLDAACDNGGGGNECPVDTMVNNGGVNENRLDLHFSNALTNTATPAGAMIGFANGDLVGNIYRCRYEPTVCTDLYEQATWLRSAANTGSKLYTYGTQNDRSGTARVRNTGNLIKDQGLYTATGYKWYQDAVSNGKPTASSRFGNPMVTSPWLYGSTMMVSLTQAYYNAAGTAQGVLRVDVDFAEISAKLISNLPSTKSQAGIVQHLGELLAASDAQTQLATSGGGFMSMNVTNSPLSELQAYSLALNKEYATFTFAQNSTDMHGHIIEAAASMASFFTPYTFLANTLAGWTYLQVRVRVRVRETYRWLYLTYRLQALS